MGDNEKVTSLKALIREVLDEISPCSCHKAYLKRDMHEPNALCHLIPELEKALTDAD